MKGERSVFRRTVLASLASTGIGLSAGCSTIRAAISQNEISYDWVRDFEGDIHYFEENEDTLVFIRRHCSESDVAVCPVVTAVKQSSGETKWEWESSETLQALATSGDGIAVVGTTTLYWLDAKTGNVHWTYSLGPMAGTSLSPATDSDTIFVRTTDEKLHAVERTTGDRRWIASIANAKGSPPVVTDKTVYFTTYDKTVTAYNTETGDQQWTFEMNRYTSSTPEIVENSLFVGDASLTVLNAATGEKQRTISIDGVRLHLLSANNSVVYATANNTLYSFDTWSSAKQWQFTAAEDETINEVFPHNGALYVLTNSHLYRLNRTTGDVEWHAKGLPKQDTPGEEIDINYSAFQNETFYLGTFTNTIYALSLQAAERA